MNNANYNEILEYATRIRKERPTLSAAELKNALQLKFIAGKDVFPSSPGVLAPWPPIWFPAGWLLYILIRKVILKDKTKIRIQEEIERVIASLTSTIVH